MSGLTKKCNACGLVKPISEFNKRSDRDGGPRPECRECSKERMRKWRQSPSGLAKESEYKANASKQQMIRTNRRRPDKAAEAAIRHKRWRDTPEGKEKLKAISKRTQQKPEFKEWRAEYRKRLYKSDPSYQCEVAARSMLGRVLKAANQNKNGKTFEILGYSAEQFRQRIECQFLPGMAWENRSHDTWHIDHRKPISAFIAQGITNPRTINALCNLRPMWAPDNLQKGASWPTPDNDNKRVDHNVA